MYAPSTTSTFDLEYEFYKDGQLTEKVLFSDYVENSYKESILKNKKVFLTNNMFFRAQRGLDYEYQKSVYQKKGNWKKDFEDKIKSNYSVRNFMKTCKGFPVLYQETHPDLKFDSMRVLFYRYPTKMPFDPDYKDDFTYYAGEGIYYETVVIP